MPRVAGSHRSAAQRVACRATLAAINLHKQDKENLNPSNLDDLGTVCCYLYSTTVKKLETKTNRAGAFQRKLHTVSWKLGCSIAKNTGLGDQLSQSEQYLANTQCYLAQVLESEANLKQKNNAAGMRLSRGEFRCKHMLDEPRTH